MILRQGKSPCQREGRKFQNLYPRFRLTGCSAERCALNTSGAESIAVGARKVDEQRAAEIFERVMTQSSEVTDFDDLHKLWTHSPEDAEFVWREMKREAEREFMTGHLAATVFEPVDWMRSAWKRAKFLGVRDSFIDEYQPEGGVEIALVDTMAQAYFLQLHWTEEAVKRTNADPRRHSYEYEQWQRYKREAAKAQRWENKGFWEIPSSQQVSPRRASTPSLAIIGTIQLP